MRSTGGIAAIAAGAIEARNDEAAGVVDASSRSACLGSITRPLGSATVPATVAWMPGLPLLAEQTLEERAIALESHAEILGRDIFPRGPLLLELLARGREGLRKRADHLVHQGIRFLDSSPRFVDETRLDILPTFPVVIRTVEQKHVARIRFHLRRTPD